MFALWNGSICPSVRASVRSTPAKVGRPPARAGSCGSRRAPTRDDPAPPRDSGRIPAHRDQLPWCSPQPRSTRSRGGLAHRLPPRQLRGYAARPERAPSSTKGSAKATAPRSALVGPAGHQQRVGSSFTIAQLAHDHFAPMPTTAPPAKPGTVQSFVSQPNLKPPTVSVITDTPPASSDDVFIAANGNDPQRGPMIFNRAGQLAGSSRSLPAKRDGPPGRALRRQTGAGMVAGLIGLGVGFGTDEIYGENYRPIAAVNAGNGYQADLHDIQITPSGAAFITAYSIVEANLSAVGDPRGRAAGRNRAGGRYQTGLVMFECTPRVVALQDSYWPRPRLPRDPMGPLPRQLDLARPMGRRQLPDLGAKHLGGVMVSTTAPARSSGGSAGATPASRWPSGTHDRMAA